MSTNKESRSKRRRITCPRCGQTLSYSAYHSHLKLPVCPGSITNICSDSDVESNSDSDIIPSESSSSREDDCDETQVPLPSDLMIDSEFDSSREDNSETHFQLPSDLSNSDSGDSEDLQNDSDTSTPELWSDTESLDEEDTQGCIDEVSQIQTVFSLCLSFIQLCFSISDRAIIYLLTLLATVFQFFSSKSPDNAMLKKFCEKFPKTLYSLRKNLKIDSAIVKYAVCPHCHKLYSEKDCFNNDIPQQTGWKCDHKEFPNHPQANRRKMCKTEIMKKVKIGKKLKMVPHRIYPYNSLLHSLRSMAARKDFLNQCEHWRQFSKLPEGWLSDVYDGHLWKEWFVKEGSPFLQAPGNLLLMMNVDWFRPFEHSTYSIGVIYLVIQNLPRALRFKLENIIVVGAIPGPHEPKYTINSYLKPMVDDLMELWKGIEVQTPDGILKTRIIRAALSYISCDIPATRKVCGFYGLRAVKGCSKCMKSFKESILDVGPVYSFWCFSFERYNGILEGMQKTWQAPEVQLFSKVINLQSILNMESLPTAPSPVVNTLMTLKSQKTTQAQEIVDPAILSTHIISLFSVPSEVSAIKTAQYIPLPPLHEKYFKEIERNYLTKAYGAIYGAEHVIQVPLRYSEFGQMNILGELYTSMKSRSERSTAVIAVWPSVTGEVLTSRRPKMEDLRAGEIQYFFMHTPIIESDSNSSKTFELPHVMAKVFWYEDHPRKLSKFKHGILISAALFDSNTDSSFIPVSRIISHCAILDCQHDFDFGTDHVKVVIPLKTPL